MERSRKSEESAFVEFDEVLEEAAIEGRISAFGDEMSISGRFRLENWSFRFLEFVLVHKIGFRFLK